MANAQKYSTRFTSPFALEYKQSENGSISCEMLRQLKELENNTYRHCKNVGMIPSQVKMTTQRDVPAHAHYKMVYILKGGDTPFFLTINSIMQKLSKEETEQSDTTFQECSYS